MTNDVKSELLEMTTDVVTAYVSGNHLEIDQLPLLIATVSNAIKNLTGSDVVVVAEPITPAVSIKKSIQPDHLVCLDCGKTLKMLKRHLVADHQMTPDDYRAKWNLPGSYPVVAPAYAEKRSALAKSFGLGKKKPR